VSALGLTYRRDIDGLRAIAVASVLLFHAFPTWGHGGFAGVDIFFVISGFLISGVILKDLQRSSFTYANFYSRRIRRIFPALALVLGAVLLFGWYLQFPYEYRFLGKHVAAGAAFVSNLALWRESGYFDAAAESKPLLHLWSLGIEEQFYLIWPLVIAWVFRRARSRVLAVTAAAALASFVCNLVLVGVNRSATFYLPFTRFWELLIGAALACAAAYDGGPVTAIMRWPLASGVRRSHIEEASAWTGLALIFTAIFLLDANAAFPGWWALLPTVGTALLIAAGPATWFNRYVLSNRVFVFVGLISYPLYLWHWPLLTFVRLAGKGASSGTVRALVLLASVVLSWLTYRLVETPIRFGAKAKRKPVFLAAAVAALAVVGVVVHQTGGRMARLEGSPFAADLASGGSDASGYPCHLDLTGSGVPIDYCLQSSASAPAAAIFGDSHAEHLFYGLQQMDRQRTWLLLGHNSCPPLNAVDVKGAEVRCEERSEAMTQALAQSGNIKLVVLSFFGSYFLDSDYAADHLGNHRGPSTTAIVAAEPRAGGKKDQFFYGLGVTIDKLEQAGKTVVVVIDIPELPFFPQDVVRQASTAHALFESASISRAVVAARQAALRSAIAELKNRHSKLLVYDPADFLCDESSCHAVVGGVLAYRDSHHLSLRGSVLFAQHFVPLLDAAVQTASVSKRGEP
jgi:peptidoglycan/LPS O-acetylase OafA/YrhL